MSNPGNPDTARRVVPKARILAFCRARPALAAVGVAIVIALAAGVGYGVRAPGRSQPAAASSPGPRPIQLDAIESAARSRDSVIWRDEAGGVYRAKVDRGRFERFLLERRQALETARTQSRNQVAAEIVAALTPIFADMKARTAGYADWYFSYTTKYELMGHALVPALDYLSRVFDRLWVADTGRRQSMVATIGDHMIAYLKDQYSDRVVHPHETEIRLQAAFDRSYQSLLDQWTRIVADQRGAMRHFIDDEAGPPERLSADAKAGLKLDWDGGFAAAVHPDVLIKQAFRGGLLSVTLKVHRSSGEPVSPDVKEATAEQADDITHVIVNLFDKVIGPVVSQMGDIAVGIIAGGAASGTTASLGMAGTPVMVTGVAAAAPIGAAVGLAATIIAEILSNRLEESLTRAEFEESIGQSVDATENAIETKMIAVLDDHIEGWYVDVAGPVSAR